MRANLCWFCSKVCTCDKAFPNGRPRKKMDCADFIEMPPDPPRISHREIADILVCSQRKIDQILVMPNGVRRIVQALAQRGISVTYECVRNRIYFYKENVSK